jgi:uncharacterized protein DUF6171
VNIFDLIRVSPEEEARRMEICRACPDFRPMKVLGGMCQLCGCLMAAKAKLKYSECPVRKWLAVDL